MAQGETASSLGCGPCSIDEDTAACGLCRISKPCSIDRVHRFCSLQLCGPFGHSMLLGTAVRVPSGTV